MDLVDIRRVGLVGASLAPSVASCGSDAPSPILDGAVEA